MAAGNQTLISLLKRSTIDDHDEVLKVCNAILKQSKGDLDASHVKTVALLKSDRYDDALRVLEEGGDKLKKTAQLEHAYALYKLGQLEEASKLAKKINDDRGAQHVEAQASYRLEDFPKAMELYKELARSPVAIENEENDIRINGGATDAQLEWKRMGYLVQKRKPRREDLEAFETAYNTACGCIARGEFGQGEVLLKRAKDLCLSLDDLPESEKSAELLPISVQQLYVLNALGKLDQAETLGSEISLNEIPDLSTRQVAQINKLTATSKPVNPFLAHRLFHSIAPLPATDRLFNFQADLKRQSDLALDLQLYKYTGVINSTNMSLNEHSSPTISSSRNGISVMNAAAHAQNQLGKLGLKSILPLLEKRPNDVGLIVTIIHLYVLTRNYGSAITVLESLFKRLERSTAANDQDVRFAPGLIAILVSLYAIQGRKLHIKAQLARAASYWRHKSKPSLHLLRAAGMSLVGSSNPDELSAAGEIFDTLQKEDPKDRLATVGYVAAYATIDADKTEVKIEQLTPVSRLVASLDVNALEHAGIPQTVTTSGTDVSRKRAGDEHVTLVKKRVRKSRLPKDYDPEKTIDPERWLPLKDRSSFRPKGKRSKQKAASSTQGGTEKGNEGFNMAGSDGMAKSSNAVISGPLKPKKKKPKK